MSPPILVMIGQFISNVYGEKGARIEFFNHTGCEEFC